MIEKVVKKLPYCILKYVKYVYFSIPDYIRCGKKFKIKREKLNKSKLWSKEQHEKFQLNQLKKLIRHAYENVPYYTRVFNERNLKPDDIKNFNDLKKIPYLTKEIIQENLDELIAKNYDKSKLKYVTTGGSTGMPMGFYVDAKADRDTEWAFITSLWERVGYNINRVNRSVILRGNIPRCNKFYEYKGRDLILSSFQLTSERIDDYIRMIEKFKPDFIQAYPSSIILLAKYILKNNIKLNLHKTKAILCSSENLYEQQRRDIETAFGIRVYSFYGHTEHACLAGECEKSSYYHIESEYGYTEILDDNGLDVCQEDEIGEIVATGFNNYVIPFIRYKTGDMAINTMYKCPCGRNVKIIKKIQGRKQEYFIDKTGSFITFTCSDDALWRVKEKVQCYQYIQKKPGSVILNIQSSEKLKDCDYQKIKEDFNSFFPGFEININEVDEITRTKRGKFKFLIQNIKY